MTPSKQAAYLGIKYFGMAMCGYDEEPSGSALRLAADIDKALDQVRAEERARSAKLVQALEFYAAGHPHHSVLFHNVDYERIPKVRTVCVISEIAKGKTGEQVYNEGMKPLFELRSGLKARQTLATYRAGDAG